MLVAYNKEYQKIVMGLLSFIPGLRDVHRLQREIDWSQSENHPIYLWKAPYSDQFVGVAVLEIGEEYVILRRLSFSPSERSGKNVYDFLSAIAQRYEHQRLMGTFATQPLVTNWARSAELQARREKFAKR